MHRQYPTQQFLSYSPREEDDDGEDFVDPFAHLNDGTPDELQKLKLLFAWTPPQADRRMH